MTIKYKIIWILTSIQTYFFFHFTGDFSPFTILGYENYFLKFISHFMFYIFVHYNSLLSLCAYSLFKIPLEMWYLYIRHF